MSLDETFEEIPEQYKSSYLNDGYKDENIRLENIRLKEHKASAVMHCDYFSPSYQDHGHCHHIPAYVGASQLIIAHACSRLGNDGMAKDRVGEIIQRHTEEHNEAKITTPYTFLDLSVTAWDSHEPSRYRGELTQRVDASYAYTVTPINDPSADHDNLTEAYDQADGFHGSFKTTMFPTLLHVDP